MQVVVEEEEVDDSDDALVDEAVLSSGCSETNFIKLGIPKSSNALRRLARSSLLLTRSARAMPSFPISCSCFEVS